MRINFMPIDKSTTAHLTTAQITFFNCTFRVYNCTSCDQLHVKICPAGKDALLTQGKSSKDRSTVINSASDERIKMTTAESWERERRTVFAQDNRDEKIRTVAMDHSQLPTPGQLTATGRLPCYIRR